MIVILGGPTHREGWLDGAIRADASKAVEDQPAHEAAVPRGIERPRITLDLDTERAAVMRVGARRDGQRETGE
jgi:hypothetical protein